MITSDQINYLIYRYLQESGFHHSAYIVGTESLVAQSNIDGSQVPPGALVSFIQKGLLYLEIEAHLNEDGTEKNCDAPFSLIEPHKCHTVEGRKRLDDNIKPMQVDEDQQDFEVAQSDITVLEGHQSEVFVCAWNPTQPLLASGSGDATSRVWEVSDSPPNSIVLRHSDDVSGMPGANKNKDVTTLEWSPDGNRLATGAYDGVGRIWNTKGDLTQMLVGHSGPIFSLKWNSDGNSLLSGSVDKTAIVWNAEDGQVKQQFAFHSEPTLDADWRNNTSFATCSTDKMIYVCKLGEERPIKAFRGHEHEVNAVKWDPSGAILASCSDDCTAKLWSLKQDNCVHDFREHEKEIYTIQWSPGGPGSPNPNQPLRLASASFDHTIKLWEPESGKCLHTLTKHSAAVYSVAFSPNGEYLASGSLDNTLHLWSMKTGEVVKTFQSGGGVFEVSWNSSGSQVAACLSDNTVVLLDIRM